jgi:hypothetical protein
MVGHGISLVLVQQTLPQESGALNQILTGPGTKRPSLKAGLTVTALATHLTEIWIAAAFGGPLVASKLRT